MTALDSLGGITINTPNKLTLLRMVSVPVFLTVYLIDFPFHFFAALVLFIAACLTDYWDGKLARRDNLITDFGKFLDPIADKLLTTAAFLGFLVTDVGYGTVWVVFLVLTREFLVASLRMVAASQDRVLAADIWGKVKTVFQMIAVIAVLFGQGVTAAGWLPAVWNGPLQIAYTVLLWAAAALTALSGVNYLIRNRDCLRFR